MQQLPRQRLLPRCCGPASRRSARILNRQTHMLAMENKRFGRKRHGFLLFPIVRNWQKRLASNNVLFFLHGELVPLWNVFSTSDWTCFNQYCSGCDQYKLRSSPRRLGLQQGADASRQTGNWPTKSWSVQEQYIGHHTTKLISGFSQLFPFV